MKKKTRNFKVRQNIFNGKTFAICEESFIDPELKDNDSHIIDVQERVQHIEKLVIENSGRVIDSQSQAMFLIMDDGFDKNIWNESDPNTD